MVASWELSFSLSDIYVYLLMIGKLEKAERLYFLIIVPAHLRKSIIIIIIIIIRSVSGANHYAGPVLVVHACDIETVKASFGFHCWCKNA